MVNSHDDRSAARDARIIMLLEQILGILATLNISIRAPGGTCIVAISHNLFSSFLQVPSPPPRLLVPPPLRPLVLALYGAEVRCLDHRRLLKLHGVEVRRLDHHGLLKLRKHPTCHLICAGMLSFEGGKLAWFGDGEYLSSLMMYY